MIVGGTILPKNYKPTECSPIIKGSVCSRKEEILKIKKITGAQGRDAESIIAEAKKKFGVDHESELYTKTSLKSELGTGTVEKILQERFNPAGPYNNTAWLSNVNIDQKQLQWSQNAKELFSLRYTFCPFQMSDFNLTGSKLVSVNLVEISAKYDAWSVVFNTDISTGGGKHWFCVFADFRHSGTQSDPYTLEYFNSSGLPANRDIASVNDWMNNVKVQFLQNNKFIDIVQVLKQKLQYSNSECGVWSLMYIYNRLLGRPSNYFASAGALDDDMIAFRANLFRYS